MGSIAAPASQFRHLSWFFDSSFRFSSSRQMATGGALRGPVVLVTSFVSDSVRKCVTPRSAASFILVGARTENE